MKKLIILFFVMIFLTGCVSTKGQGGAFIGGLAGMAGSALGKGNRPTTIILGSAGAILGYMIGNEMDKEDHMQKDTIYVENMQTDSYQNNDNYYQSNNNYYQRNSNYQRNNDITDCRKITTRLTDEMGRTSETIEEICEGNRIERTY